MLRRRDLEVLTTTLFEASAISFEAAASTDDVFWQLLYSRVLTTQILSKHAVYRAIKKVHTNSSHD